MLLTLQVTASPRPSQPLIHGGLPVCLRVSLRVLELLLGCQLSGMAEEGEQEEQ